MSAMIYNVYNDCNDLQWPTMTTMSTMICNVYNDCNDYNDLQCHPPRRNLQSGWNTNSFYKKNWVIIKWVQYCYETILDSLYNCPETGLWWPKVICTNNPVLSVHPSEVLKPPILNLPSRLQPEWCYGAHAMVSMLLALLTDLVIFVEPNAFRSSFGWTRVYSA